MSDFTHKITYILLIYMVSITVIIMLLANVITAQQDIYYDSSIVVRTEGPDISSTMQAPDAYEVLDWWDVMLSFVTGIDMDIQGLGDISGSIWWAVRIFAIWIPAAMLVFSIGAYVRGV